jgi:outer membrane biosynthesis protein TonB
VPRLVACLALLTLAAWGPGCAVRMGESSGDPAFDAAALEAVRAVEATGLAPPPAELARFFQRFGMEFHGDRRSAP